MRVIALALLVAGCGDNALPREPMFTGLSGERIKLQWYLYQDGTTQPDTAAFYDTELHVRCERVDWIDGIARCTPVADPTVFRDNECTTELGRALDNVRTPKFFVGYDKVEGKPRAARLLRAGMRTETPSGFYEKRDDKCVQIGEPTTFAYYDLPIEVGREHLVAMWSEEEQMTDRLGLSLLASDEGLAAPIGFRDHALDLDCHPGKLPDGTSACIPSGAPAQHFADWRCEEPVVVATEPPSAVIVNDTYGCPTYRAASTEHTGLLFRRDNGTCVQAFRGMGEHAYRIGASLELAPVERVVENDPKRRLQRFTITTGNLVTLDNRLFDLGTRSECTSYGNGELAVCVPINTLAGTRLFANNKCSLEVFIADVPKVQCTKSTFAVVETTSIHAIDKPHVGSLFVADLAGTCRLRTQPADSVPYTLGPPVPAEAFVGGVIWSER